MQDLHFGAEAFGDSVVAGEAPHAGDLLTPRIQRIAQCHEGREPATTERGNVLEEAPRQFPVFFLVVMFLQQQVTEPLLETVNRLQRRVPAQIFREARMLVRLAPIKGLEPGSRGRAR